MAICKVCGKEFKSRSGLSDHERRHSKAAPYRCCSKQFFSKANLQRHRCNVHGSKKTEKCYVCAKTFATKAEVNTHRKAAHANPTLTCNICDRKFAKEDKLKDHVDSHTGAKRHTCVCGKSYTYGSGLSRHKRICQYSKA